MKIEKQSTQAISERDFFSVVCDFRVRLLMSSLHGWFSECDYYAQFLRKLLFFCCKKRKYAFFNNLIVQRFDVIATTHQLISSPLWILVLQCCLLTSPPDLRFKSVINISYFRVAIFRSFLSIFYKNWIINSADVCVILKFFNSKCVKQILAVLNNANDDDV